MIRLKCIYKERGSDSIVKSYRLQDIHGYCRNLTPTELKEQIKKGNIEVINLKLTSDNKIINKRYDVQTYDSDVQISNRIKIAKESAFRLMQKAMLLNRVIEIPTICGHQCYLINQLQERYILYIPDDVIQLNHSDIMPEFTAYIENIKGHIKVVGGTNLENANSMFYYCKAKYLDLSDFDTRKVTCMRNMFSECRTNYLDLSCLDTRNVVDMSEMFDTCRSKVIDFSAANTKNVENMSQMFFFCHAKYIDISGMSTERAKDMTKIFLNCTAKVKVTDPKLLEELNKTR